MFPSPLALPPPCCTSGESDVTEKEMRERERKRRLSWMRVEERGAGGPEGGEPGP